MSAKKQQSQLLILAQARIRVKCLSPPCIILTFFLSRKAGAELCWARGSCLLLVPRSRTPQAASLQFSTGCRDVLPAGASLQLQKCHSGNRTGTCRSQRCWPGDLLARAIQPKLSQSAGNVHKMTHSPQATVKTHTNSPHQGGNTCGVFVSFLKLEKSELFLMGMMSNSGNKSLESHPPGVVNRVV